MGKRQKDFITLLDFSADEITGLLRLSGSIKKQPDKVLPQVFAGKTGVLIFEKPSLRTRITFETAINELNGHCINLDPDSVQMGKRESIRDVAKNLERWVHLLVARTFAHDTILQLARYSAIPVINALTDRDHPCQALAFALTAQERFGDSGRINVAFIGDGNNVCNSIMALCAKIGYNFTIACPKGYEPPAELLSACNEVARGSGAKISVTHSPVDAVAGAQCIYTDVWASMGQENEAQQRSQIFKPYQVNKELLAHAPSAAFVSHCLPAHRGEEIAGDVLDSPKSMALDEAENRLHVQKAVIIHLFS